MALTAVPVGFVAGLFGILGKFCMDCDILMGILSGILLLFWYFEGHIKWYFTSSFVL